MLGKCSTTELHLPDPAKSYVRNLCYMTLKGGEARLQRGNGFGFAIPKDIGIGKLSVIALCETEYVENRGLRFIFSLL